MWFVTSLSYGKKKEDLHVISTNGLPLNSASHVELEWGFSTDYSHKREDSNLTGKSRQSLPIHSFPAVATDVTCAIRRLKDLTD